MPQTTIVGLRHAKAALAPTPASGAYASHSEGRLADMARPLNEIGLSQLYKRRDSLSKMTFDLIITSPALRAIETAEGVTGVDRSMLITCPELYTPEGLEGYLIDEIFTDLKNAPAWKYLLYPKNHGFGPGPVDRFANEAGKVLHAILGEHPLGEEGLKVLIAGHAVFTPLAIFSLLLNYGIWYPDVLGINMDEAGAFVVSFDPENPTGTIELEVLD